MKFVNAVKTTQKIQCRREEKLNKRIVLRHNPDLHYAQLRVSLRRNKAAMRARCRDSHDSHDIFDIHDVHGPLRTLIGLPSRKASTFSIESP